MKSCSKSNPRPVKSNIRLKLALDLCLVITHIAQSHSCALHLSFDFEPFTITGPKMPPSISPLTFNPFSSPFYPPGLHQQHEIGLSLPAFGVRMLGSALPSVWLLGLHDGG